MISKARSILIVTVSLLGLSGFIFIFAGHLVDEFNWLRHFKGVIPLGENCIYTQGKWQEECLETLAPLDSGALISLPFRGRVQIKTSPSQHLRIECAISSHGIDRSSSLWISTGPLFGESCVYVNGSLRQKLKSRDEGSFPINLNGNDETIKVSMVSRGTESGVAGPASLIPPYVTTDLSKVKSINRFLASLHTEASSLRIGFSVFCLLLLFAFWHFGMRYRDVELLLFFALLVVFQNYLIYSRSFGSSLVYVLQRAEGVNSLTLSVLVWSFLLSFTRVNFFPRRLQHFLIICFAVTAIFIGFCPQDIFYRWRLLGMMQAYLAALLSIVGIVLLQIRTRNEVHLLAKKRQVVASVFFGVTACIFFTQAVLEDRFGIFIAPFVQISLLSWFLAVLVHDALRRHRDYFGELRKRLLLDAELGQARVMGGIAKSLAHDVRRPLEMVEIFLDTLSKEKWTTSQMNQFKADVKHAVKSAQKMIFDLLQLGEVDQLQTINTSICDLTQNAISRVRSIRPVDEWNIQIENQIEKSLHLNVDGPKIERVIENILINATEAMKLGGLIRIFSAVVNDRVRITIHNSGSYITPEAMRDLFRISSRHDGDIRKGFGIGLAAAKHIVLAHLGEISVSSDKNSGTAFVIELPLQHPYLTKPSNAKKPPRFIIVDDDEFILIAWKIYYRDAFLEGFTSPEDFLNSMPKLSSILNENTIIIVDFRFSNSSMNGAQLAEVIRATYPNVKILVSSNDHSIKNDYMKLFDGRISKKPGAL